MEVGPYLLCKGNTGLDGQKLIVTHIYYGLRRLSTPCIFLPNCSFQFNPTISGSFPGVLIIIINVTYCQVPHIGYLTGSYEVGVLVIQIKRPKF